jgi:hypothetical protein
MKRIFFYAKLVVIVSLVVITGCEKSSFQEPFVDLDQSNLTLKSVDLRTELINDYAKILATSLSNEIKTIIKNETQKRFDGDYDVLASTFEQIEIENKTIREMLKECRSGKARSIINFSRMDNNAFFERTDEEIPNLQISVPILCDEWNPEEFTPPVAYLPFDYSEKESKEINAYDSNGNLLKLDPLKEPDFPVIVVRVSERVDKNKELISTEATLAIEENNKLKSVPTTPTNLSISHGTSKSLMLEWNDSDYETSYEVWRMAWEETQFWHFSNTVQNDNNFINNYTAEGKKYWYKIRAINGEGNSAWSNIVASTSSARNDGEWLKIKRMKFTSSGLSSVEPWVGGAPEMRIRVVQGLQGGANLIFTSGRFEPNKRNDIKDKWWYFEVPIVPWYTATVGTVLNIDWREEDGWPEGTVTFQISGSYEDKSDDGTVKYGGTITISNDPGDSHIGNNLVHYWDIKDQIYNLTGFEYQLVY